MAGLDPAIHVLATKRKTWMPGTRPGMTSRNEALTPMPLRLIFMGTPDFSVPTLLALSAQGHDLSLIHI